MEITSLDSVQPQDFSALQDQAKLTQLSNQVGSGENREQKLKDAAEGFESIFMGKLWEKMRATVPKDGYLHSKEEDFYLSMFDRELTQKMAAAGGIGLGKMLYDSLKDNLSEASQQSMPLNPLQGVTTTLNPLQVKTPSSTTTSQEQSVVETGDSRTLQKLEQLIRKIEQDHGDDASQTTLMQDV